MREIGIDVKLPTGEWDGDETVSYTHLTLPTNQGV